MAQLNTRIEKQDRLIQVRFNLIELQKPAENFSEILAMNSDINLQPAFSIRLNSDRLEILNTDLMAIALVTASSLTKLPWPRDSKGTFRSSIQSAPLSTTHSGGFTLSLLLLNVKQESCEYQFL